MNLLFGREKTVYIEHLNIWHGGVQTFPNQMKLMLSIFGNSISASRLETSSMHLPAWLRLDSTVTRLT